MLRVAVVCGNAMWRKTITGAMLKYGDEEGIRTLEVDTFDTVEGLSGTIDRMRDGYFDLAICCLEAPGEYLTSPDEVSIRLVSLSGLRAKCPNLRMVLASRDPFKTIHAYELDASFLLLTGTYADFRRAVDKPLAARQRERAARIAVRSPGIVAMVNLDDIMFAEATKRGSLLHLGDGQELTVRVPLQALHDSLDAYESSQCDGGRLMVPRFVKAGNSFVINLDNIRHLSKGVALFANGETVIVPVRRRKEVQDAFMRFRIRLSLPSR